MTTTASYAHRQTDRATDRQSHRQRQRQTEPQTDRQSHRQTDRATERMELLPYKHVSIISHAYFITAKQNEYNVLFSLFSLRWPSSKHAMLTPREKSK